jgi:signal peptidase I
MVFAPGAVFPDTAGMTTETDTAAEPPPAKKTFRQEVVETFQTVVYALMIAFVLRVVLFEPFTIPSASMEPGLLVGDYIIATKWNYGWSKHSIPFSPPLFHGRVLKMGAGPQRGDVVVFKLPRDPKQTYVKRLIGLPGDRVQVKGGVVTVNDKVIVRTPAGDAQDPDGGFSVAQYVEHRPDGQAYTTFDQGPDHDMDNTDLYVVPEDHYFMMGDNRDNSLDSRWPEAMGVGFVPAENLVGKVRVVLVSWRGGASLFNPITWVTKFDPHRMVRPVH